MRSALTLVRLHGADEFETLNGPELHLDAQIAEFKRLCVGGKTHPEIAEAQLWTSDQGILKRARFVQVVPASAGTNEGSAPDSEATDDSAGDIPEQTTIQVVPRKSLFRRGPKSKPEA